MAYQGSHGGGYGDGHELHDVPPGNVRPRGSLAFLNFG